MISTADAQLVVSPKWKPEVRHTVCRNALSKTSGFIAEAGFSHSLSPARNCTFACTYCYVPTMGPYGGLQPEDWRRWGQYTAYKERLAELLERELRPNHVIYCSPVVDPYQPAEEYEQVMPQILRALLRLPPRVFAVQTRGPLILRDLPLLVRLAGLTTVRIGFSVTTNREDVRRCFEPLCSSLDERWNAIRSLREAGLAVHATLAPILPCDPEELAHAAVDFTTTAVIADPFHIRTAKPRGAVTHQRAFMISSKHGWERWHDPLFQTEILDRIRRVVEGRSRQFGAGPPAFAWLAAS